MKKTLFIGAMLLAGMMIFGASANAQTRKEKKAAKRADWEYEQKIKKIKQEQEIDQLTKKPAAADEVFVDIPCYEESVSKGEGDPYFRELGTASDIELGKARQMALENANSLIKRRLGGVVKGLATDYSKTVSTKSAPTNMAQILESEFTKVVDKVVNDADKPCEKRAKDQKGQWVSYYVIWVKKTDLAEKMAEAAAASEEIKVEIDRDKFRKYAEEYMSKQQ